ncbi:MAG: hypothetical protein U9P14_10215 [Gemmatimonadota bacterium]|nr:hypothetical protein [Gemmatimonadota bacterium]
MAENKKSRVHPGNRVYEQHERRDCFGDFFGESVSDVQGVVQRSESANKCQDCPDAEICFRLNALRQMEILAENQSRIITRLNYLESRLPLDRWS